MKKERKVESISKGAEIDEEHKEHKLKSLNRKGAQLQRSVTCIKQKVK